MWKIPIKLEWKFLAIIIFFACWHFVFGKFYFLIYHILLLCIYHICLWLGIFSKKLITNFPARLEQRQPQHFACGPLSHVRDLGLQSDFHKCRPSSHLETQAQSPSPDRLCGHSGRDWLLSQLPQRPDCCCPLLQIPPGGWGGLRSEQKGLVRKGEAGRQLNRASQLTWVSPLRPVERGSTRPPGWPQATQQAGP